MYFSCLGFTALSTSFIIHSNNVDPPQPFSAIALILLPATDELWDFIGNVICLHISSGNCDHRGVWCGVYSAALGCWLLLSLQRMEREVEIRSQALLCYR